MSSRERLKIRTSTPARASAAILLALAALAQAACSPASSGSGDVPAKDLAAPASAPATSAAVASAAATEPASAAPAAPAASSVAAAGAEAPPSAQPVVKSAAPGGPLAPSASPSAVASASPSAVASEAPSAAASAAPAASAEPALTVQGQKTQEAAFMVWMQSAKTYKVGQSGSVEVVVVPKGEYHCNEAYPYKVKLGAAPAGVSFASDVVRGASVSATRASIRVPFTATAAGDAKISGKVSFSVCKSDQCVIDSRDVAATVKIE